MRGDRMMDMMDVTWGRSSCMDGWRHDGDMIHITWCRRERHGLVCWEAMQSLVVL